MRGLFVLWLLLGAGSDVRHHLLRGGRQAALSEGSRWFLGEVWMLVWLHSWPLLSPPSSGMGSGLKPIQSGSILTVTGAPHPGDPILSVLKTPVRSNCKD